MARTCLFSNYRFALSDFCGLGRFAYKYHPENLIQHFRDYRAAGGTWKRYVAEPRKQLLVLRRLVERGRALPPRIWMRGWTSLARTLIGREPSDDGAKAVHDLFGRKDLPDVLFWKVLKFWRSDRDV